MKIRMRLEMVFLGMALSSFLGGGAAALFFGQRAAIPIEVKELSAPPSAEPLGPRDLESMVARVAELVLQAQLKLQPAASIERAPVPSEDSEVSESKVILALEKEVAFLRKKIDSMNWSASRLIRDFPPLTDLEKQASFAEIRLPDGAYSNREKRSAHEESLDRKSRFKTMEDLLRLHGPPDSLGGRKYGGVEFNYAMDYGQGITEHYTFIIREGVVVSADLTALSSSH